MRRLSIALAAAVICGTGALAGTAQAAPAPHSQARVLGPPFPYADCIKAAKDNKESPSYAKWHCDQLVQKGWVKRPKAEPTHRPKAEPAHRPKTDPAHRPKANAAHRPKADPTPHRPERPRR
ncbi:hypothetical protein QZH56_34600 [Streptomyces olivoreticuli]|uniref:hypothetical protein n=1 Tax=Streptomyces olivoreticuli TaxID=68246 RepID=UPI002657C46F|nr:hypothetical protein [Streptomyces olivoreticuli]WKK23766.1 hypothetical protein QZH56_34600 [Streptomyces olivoreticuli]